MLLCTKFEPARSSVKEVVTPSEVCCDCNKKLAPDRRFKWIRDSDRRPLCDDCSAQYDFL